jgi:hypothetical protein
MVADRKEPGVRFVTYENRFNPHVTIHRVGCGHIRKHGGAHKYGRASTRNTRTTATPNAVQNKQDFR